MIDEILELIVGGVMKPAQTRIKQVSREDGSVFYTPQHKCWGIWCDFSDYKGVSDFRHTHPLDHCMEDHYLDVEYAKSKIDKYIFSFTKRNEELRLRKGQQVTHIEYP